MKILFYIEPLTPVDSPYAQSYFLFRHIKLMMDSLDEKEWEFYFASNTAIAENFETLEYKEKIKKYFSFSQKEFKKFYSSTIEIQRRWNEGIFSEKEMEYYKILISNKFNKINFDIIITFSSVPYLKELYPDALVLNYEFGVFSRKPYPTTFFLDPVGPGGYSYIKKYYSEILKNINISEEEKEIFKDFKREIKKVILKNNPFENKIKKLREKYDYIVLLPLQFSNFYLFDPKVDYKSQFEYLEDVLIKTSEFQNIGVIVTEHLAEKVLTLSNIEYFKKNYSNFIYFEEINNYIAVSQLIIPFVDGIINVSSAIGYQCFLWNKKLCSLGKSYLVEFSDSDNLSNIGTMLKDESDFNYKEKLFYWIVTNYTISEDYIKNGKWLKNFLEHGLKNKDNLVNFYNYIDEPKHYIEHLKKNLSSDLNESLILNNSQYSKIWVDAGKGYTEEETYASNISEKISFKIRETYIKTLLIRFYGIEKIKIDKVSIENKNNEIIEINNIKYSTFYKINDIFYLDNERYIEYYINSEVKEAVFEVSDFKDTKRSEFLEAIEFKEEEYKKKLDEKQKILNQKDEVINKKSEIINQKEEIINKKNKIISESIEMINEIKRTNFSKLLHLYNRVYHQLIFGNAHEKKKFFKWIKRDSNELSDTRYIFLDKVDKILKK